MTIANGPNGPVTLGAKGLDNGGNVLTGLGKGRVAAGSTDAVTGDQLAEIDAKLGQAGVASTATDAKLATAQDAADAADDKAQKAQEAADKADEKAVKAQEATTDLANKAVQYGDEGKTSIVLGGPASTDGGQTGGTRLSNVAQGSLAPNSTDAVNGTQLRATNQALADGLGGGAKLNPDGTVARPTYAIHNPGSTTATTPHNDVGSALGALDAGVVGNTAAIDKLGKDLANGTAGPIQQGATPGQLALVGPQGATGPQGLTNVAPGAVAAGSTDAVNGGQLHAVEQAANKGWQLSAGGLNETQVKPGEVVDISGDANIGVTKGAADRNVKLALARKLDVDSVVAGGTVLNGDSVTIGGGAKGPVKLSSNGLDNGGNALTGIGAGNVAAGSTDAVNGDQLAATDAKVATAQDAAITADGKAVKAQEAADAADDKAEKAQGTADQALALGNNSVQYDGDDKKSMTLRGEESIDGGKTGGTRLGNVAQGSLADLSTDAVNGSQLRATNQVLANGLGGGAAVQADGSITRPTYVIHNPGSMPGSTAATSAYDNVGDALGALDRGVTGNTAAIADLGKSAVHYDKNADGSPNTGAMTLAGGVDAAGNPTGTAIRNVAPGSVAAGSMEAVNGGQLHDIAQTAGKGWTLSAQGANASQVKPGETVDISGADANIQVAKGADDRNVKVALSRNLAVDSVTAGNTTVNGDGVTIAGGPNGPVKLTSKGLDNGGNVLTGIGAGNVAAGSTDAVNGDQLAATDARAVRAQASADAADAKAAAARAMAHAADMKAAAAQAAADAADMKAVAAQYAADAAAMKVVTAQLAADAAGLKAEQANGTAERALALGNNSVQYDDAGKTGLTLGGPKSEDGGRTGGTRLANVAQGLLSPTSTDAVNGAQLHATNERVAAHGTQLALLETGQSGAFRMNNRSGLPAPDARGDDAVAGGFGAVASGARSTAIGSNAVASGAGSVALGHGATDGGRDNVVSVGREGAERQVTNVAAGTRPTDAVNLGQLSNAIDHGLVAATGYTDHHVNALRFDLANVRRDADAGTASAMAVAGLPQAFGDSGGMIGGAIGVYQNETAFALGVSKVFGDGRTVVKGGATYVETSRGSTFGGNVGIGYQF